MIVSAIVHDTVFRVCYSLSAMLHTQQQSSIRQLSAQRYRRHKLILNTDGLLSSVLLLNAIQGWPYIRWLHFYGHRCLGYVVVVSGPPATWPDRQSATRFAAVGVFSSPGIDDQRYFGRCRRGCCIAAVQSNCFSGCLDQSAHRPRDAMAGTWRVPDARGLRWKRLTAQRLLTHDAVLPWKPVHCTVLSLSKRCQT